MKSKLLIIGASGHGKVVADIAFAMEKWKSIAFLDDNDKVKSSIGFEVIGCTKDILKFKDDYDIFIAVGNNKIRKKFHNKLEDLGATIPVLIHPDAIVGSQVEIGNGTVVMAGAVLNCCTTIGKGCIINTSSSIDHDNKLEDFVHISPGVHLAGTVQIGQGTWLGIGSKVINNVNITANCIFGAGSVVVNDIMEQGKYIGVPARKIDE
ncbi:acetyltransferase [Virgibacillus sp. 6R]|uniref:acetyltransferase n=1 Tax=Metabacillus sp. 22489 TaxID=3453928 RepID=UPI0011A5E069